MAGLIDAIINPAQTDVLGALDKGRERQATDMAGELLAQTLPGKVGDLARLSPDKALKFAELTGIPLTSEGRIKNLMGVNIMGAKLLQAGQTQEAMQFLSEEADKIESVTNEPAIRLRAVVQAIDSGDQETISNFTKSGLALDPSAPSALDQAKTSKFNAEAAALGGKGAAIPPSLIKGLPDDMAARVSDAFTASGGGDKGMKAANEERVLVHEDMRRGKAHESLSIIYPNVTPEEMTQLQAAIDTAPSVEKGLATAETVRTNQRSAQKAAVMSDRSLILVNNILANSELKDVVGSSEGKFGGTDQPTGALPLIGGFISDKEAEAIADIEEITNILTVPAMKIMTGILSESDLRLLKTISGGAFNRTRGIERFKLDVGQIQGILSRASIIGKLPPKDREAAIWATDKKNMNKPQSKQIRKKLGL
jgi:hypothetical protein